ncbi:MAG: HEAT repeat domain-containing protein [Verrucomicrobia bacterium]|nr:HEAT repeat domain-containing protein [Verrucomicrobiota bacterium]
MTAKIIFRLSVAAACLLSASSLLAFEFSELHCLKSRSFWAPIDSSEHRKYAPSREIDVLHLTLDVTPDFRQRTVSGKTTLRFKPIAKPLDELGLDAVDLNVQSVTATASIRSYQVTGKRIIITFENAIPSEQEASVTIVHSAQPSQGLYFRTPEMGYQEGETHLWTQGEAIEARHWFPCYDSPNEKFTSEIICRVPEGMVVLSNGKLVSDEKDAATGLKAVRWLQDKPHVNYLISLVAGYFKKVEDKYKDIAMAFHVPPSDIDQAVNSFRNTKDMMAFFEQEIGVPYPWAKYDQVCVRDFVMGGMENTSITTLTDRTLFTTATENIRDSDGLVAHELAHQWFGDLVTCKDWSQIWLNEGFATYYAHLYDGHLNGRDSMLYGLFQSAKGILEQTNDTRSIVYRQYDSPNDQFNYLAYPKGGWVLHMLRSQLGEELYRRCIKTYLERHQYANVDTEDLNAVLEELSGRSFDQFFDQWVYHGHYPELEANYSWDAKAKLAKVSIAQTQKLSPEVLLFNFPLTVRFKSQSSTTERQITVKEKSEDFYFPLPEAPQIVRLDPNYTLLAKIKFSVPDALLHAQLADKDDVMGRLLAIEQLSAKKDHATAAQLKTALQNDPFYGVRVEAARALRSIHTDEAFAALTDSLSQSDARVRQQVVIALAGFYREEAYAVAQCVLGQEKNPDILAQAMRAIAAYGKPEVHKTLLGFLNSQSYRNELADAAVAAMRRHDDPSGVPVLLDTLKQRQAAFTSFGLGRAIDALAFLARNEKEKDEVREFIAGFTQSKKQSVQLSAIAALGTLGDAKAMALLEAFAGAGKETRERGAAERAISSIRAAKKSAEELGTLREEVLSLQKAHRDVRKELDELKKKLEAVGDQAARKDTKAKGNPSPRPLRHAR